MLVLGTSALCAATVQEIDALLDLDHPNVVGLKEYFVQNNRVRAVATQTQCTYLSRQREALESSAGCDPSPSQRTKSRVRCIGAFPCCSSLATLSAFNTGHRP